MEISLENYSIITTLIKSDDREGLEEFLQPIKLTFNEKALIKHSDKLLDIVPAMIMARPVKGRL